MATASREHPPSMTYRCAQLPLTSMLAFACALSLGCDAPEKTVGQETDGGTDSGSGSDSDSDCGGVLPCGTNASDSASGTSAETGGATESGGPTGSETGVSGECGELDNASECGAQGCIWRNTLLLTEEKTSCELTDGDGLCTTPEPGNPDPGGICSPCPVDGEQYWARELEDGTWEVLTDGCFVANPSGFTLCEFAGEDPAACDCACSGTSASLPDGFETTIDAAGCSDMSVFGATADGSIGITLSTGFEFAPVAAAVDAGTTLTTTHDVSEFAQLSVLVGNNVMYPECNDALDKDAYSIDQEWPATAGTVEIVIVPEENPPEFGTQGFATVTITGLEVSYGGTTEALETVVFEDVAVGWLPG